MLQAQLPIPTMIRAALSRSRERYAKARSAADFGAGTPIGDVLELLRSLEAQGARSARLDEIVGATESHAKRIQRWDMLLVPGPREPFWLAKYEWTRVDIGSLVDEPAF